MENEPILKKTLYTVAVMVAAWVAFVGALSILAVVITSHAVAPPEGKEAPGLDSRPSLGTVPAVPPKPGAARGNHGQPI